MKSIVVIIDYFGSWPEWFPLFLASCKRNSTINWLIHSDNPDDLFNIENVAFRYISREDYLIFISEKLNINFQPQDNYKICDLKPAYGFLYESEIRDYDFFGYGDIDVIYGNIRKFYTEEILTNNIVSTCSWCISGHFGLIRNTDWLRRSFMRYPKWKKILEIPSCQRFDEDLYIRVFLYPFYPRVLKNVFFRLYDFLNPQTRKYREKLYLVEQFTTPLVPFKWRGDIESPTVWFWKKGSIFNESEGDIEFIYLHFMNFKFTRYMDSRFGKEAYWQGLKKIVHLPHDCIGDDMRIDRNGFHPLTQL